MLRVKHIVAAALLCGVCSTSASALTFNSDPFDIPDGSETFIPIKVSGVSGATEVSVTLHDVSHSYPDDMVFGLVNENLSMGIIFLSGAGGDWPVFGQTWTFSDAASDWAIQTDYDDYFGTQPVPLEDGVFLPSNFDELQFYTIESAGQLNDLLAGDVNGTWSLYTRDRYYFDSGTVAGGFSLTFKTENGGAVGPGPGPGPDPDPETPPIIGSEPSAVPEPASWALMILGFGLVGARLRARKNVLAV